MAFSHFCLVIARKKLRAARDGRRPLAERVAILVVCALPIFAGCAHGNRRLTPRLSVVDAPRQPVRRSDSSRLRVAQGRVAHHEDAASDDFCRPYTRNSYDGDVITVSAEAVVSFESLSELEALAADQNPNLRRLSQKVAAAQAKVISADKLPDPTLGVNIFGHPIETAAGSQRSNLAVMQMIPWLKRLDAQSQQAYFEAMVLGQMFAVERLKVIADLRERWFRLYVLRKNIEINRANQELLNVLIEVANARVATGNASQGDVLLGALELSKLEEQILTFQQQLESNKAELNRLVGRDAASPIDVPSQLSATLPEWSYPMLRQLARERQPAFAAAQLRTQATRWGVEVAKLRRRPDVSLSAQWFAIDGNRPRTRVVDVGRDAWSLGAQVSVPLWREKYDAIEQEARWKHFASHASMEDVERRYDSLLLDLWEQAKAADATSRLYQQTILPQARQALQADQQSYSNGAVEFDRVISDFRNLLTLELGSYAAVTRLRTALARIEQAVGGDLPSSQPEVTPLPTPRVAE